jgi:hypothetical protein
MVEVVEGIGIAVVKLRGSVQKVQQSLLRYLEVIQELEIIEHDVNQPVSLEEILFWEDIEIP